MKSTAAGQLLGYSLQFPRALCHLLQIPSGGIVGVEVLGDVTTFFPEGIVLTEEDKSSIGSNPLTDRSSNLWKTFYNWVSAVLDSDVDLEQTRFVLYCNQSGQKSLVQSFDEVQSQADASDSIANAKAVLNDINKDHSIWKYFDYVVNQHPKIFALVLQKFELIIGKDAGYDDVRKALIGKNIYEDYVENIMDYLGGWVQKTINEKISQGVPALISFDEFNDRFLAFFHMIRQRALIDWASFHPPSNDDVSGEIAVHPTYIRQLEYIDLPDDDIVDAVSDYLKADINRNAWIENGILDEIVADDFERRLVSYWKNKRREIQHTNSMFSEEIRGQILLSRCQTYPIEIRGEQPPHPTVEGTYHALADRENVGWHPRWERLINEEEGENGAIS
ncbi:MAG: hypothetical protein JXR23_01550 [Pontiellaceae bacterium]|nr:hypothetical protein [Pontiellaceae bacterium]